MEWIANRTINSLSLTQGGEAGGEKDLWAQAQVAWEGRRGGRGGMVAPVCLFSFVDVTGRRDGEEVKGEEGRWVGKAVEVRYFRWGGGRRR